MRREVLMGTALVALAAATPARALLEGFKAKADALLTQSYAGLSRALGAA